MQSGIPISSTPATRTFFLRVAGALVFFIFAVLGCHAPAAGVVGPVFGPPASWVKAQFFSKEAVDNPVDASADDHQLLLERQINVTNNELFFHSIQQVLTLGGVQKDATLTFDFNPGYQTLTLHWARLWRGADHLEQLDTNAVKVVQRESEMEDYILNGRQSAILVLNDVRVGDIIDYAYSLKGGNPVFGGHFSSAVPLQFDQPIEHMITRVLWPAQRHLYARIHGSSAPARAIPGKDITEYIWDVSQRPGLSLEDALPQWCDPQPWVQLSEFKTWAEVNQWASALFQTSGVLSPALAQRIANWGQLPEPEQQVLAALRFVQDDVRYFGIEIAASTVKPAEPSTVFARRFGDCKDKSMLFVTILRALGIEAYPVLVNTTVGRGLEDWEPTANAFDHCIAVVQISGQPYWLDPTMNYQRGPLAAHYLPPYQLGLVISPQTRGLTPIPLATGLPETMINEYFQLHGKNEAADLKVVTTATGRDAEQLRILVATTKRTDLEKRYTHLYADQYPGLRMAGPIDFTDDEQQNRVQLTEYYSITQAWGQADSNKRFHFQLYPTSLSAGLKKPVAVDRKFPLAIDYPNHVSVHTEIVLPEAWQAEADHKSVLDEAFTFQKASRVAGNKMIIEYNYQTLADSVSPDRVGEYLRHVDQTSQNLGYSLSWR